MAKDRRPTMTNNMMTTIHRLLCPCSLWILIVILFQMNSPIESKSASSLSSIITMKSFLTQFLNKAIELQRENHRTGKNRQAKWNEFIEEQNLKQTTTSRNQQQSSTITTTTTSTSISTTTSSPNAFNQSLIDETKDPNSPYYITMVSSNIGGNRSSQHSLFGSSGSGSSVSSGHQSGHQSGFITKLFTYAFSTIAPARAMLTTKRPLVTYINVSNLEEHDSEESSYNRLSSGSNLSNPPEQYQLSLLNSADPSQSMLPTKKRLPECATQQVCSAHYVRSNHTQRLCDCPRDFNWNCEEPDPNEEHTIDLSRKQEFKTKRNSLEVEVYTQVKLCENLRTLKPCKTPTDWTIMALQSERTGKAHFVVACKCPDSASFEGPFTHKHPPYARFPGIRVYGMLCNQGIRKSKLQPKALEIDLEKVGNEYPEFPWELAYAVINSTATQGFW